jgi:hypothetical protein
MMTQTAPEGEPHFVIAMTEHTEMCGQLARAFGNDRFERIDPFEEVVHVVENHDRGWDGYDANPGLDPVTRLPYIMARTPTPDAVKTNVGSPDFNEAHHPYCGLLSSMHSVGLAAMASVNLSYAPRPPRRAAFQRCTARWSTL